jgi:hypothetical protein
VLYLSMWNKLFHRSRPTGADDANWHFI